MNIALRKKVLKSGKTSLFLDYYLPKAKQKRRKEFLKLYLFDKPKNKLEKSSNKKMLELAESIRVKRLLELQHRQHDFSHLIDKSDSSEPFVGVMAYSEKLRAACKRTSSVYQTWKGMYNYLSRYLNDTDINLRDINEEWVEDFKKYLIGFTNPTDGTRARSVNTASLYFTRFKGLFNSALKDKIIDKNPAALIGNIPMKESQREFLTLEELKQAIKTPCKDPLLKKAFLFSCLTGLRLSDLEKLRSTDIQYSQEQGWYIRFTQKKTQSVETLPISDQAKELLGDTSDSNECIFKGLLLGSTLALRIQNWLVVAGIHKNITFHCARHTFATLQLTLGTDIYTVSKLLGHKKIETTQIYGKIIDATKVAAVNRIPDLNL